MFRLERICVRPRQDITLRYLKMWPDLQTLSDLGTQSRYLIVNSRHPKDNSHVPAMIWIEVPVCKAGVKES
jgi:hypothetical protein